MTEEESGAVHTRMTVLRRGEQIVWVWAVGECSVSLSLPAINPMSDTTYADVDFLIHHMPELVESGITEAEIWEAMQELEEELGHDVSAEEG